MSGSDQRDRNMWIENVERVKQQALQKGLWYNGDGMVIAVSGGPDSMLLMHVLHELSVRSSEEKLRLVVAHVHHGFRGEESDREARIVEAEAAKLGIPFVMTRVDAPGYAEREGINPQAAARILRYHFLRETADRYGMTRIALAHHGDDQAETVLMHLIRGSGSAGLSGMSWSREQSGYIYVRPLLHMRKREILELCAYHGITYAEDSSNQKRDYTRNRIRMDILPLLEEENPRIIDAIGQTAEVLRSEQEWLEQQAVDYFHQHIVSWDNRMQQRAEPYTYIHKANLDMNWQHVSYKLRFLNGCAMDRNTFSKVHVALQRRLIKLILNYLLPDSDQAAEYGTIERIRVQALAEEPTTWKADIGSGLQFRREYNQLLWVNSDQEHQLVHVDGSDVDSQFIISDPNSSGQAAFPGMIGTLSWRIVSVPELNRETQPNRFHAAFDADRLEWPLVVRTRRPGDRMRLQGLKGSKKVQDMFVDYKIPPSLRDSIPLIEDGAGQLLWIAGLRRSDQSLVTNRTVRVLELSLRI
ncbi:tRNA lysidine(34) synthetase TilS [Paenibacillus marinisediminis]